MAALPLLGEGGVFARGDWFAPVKSLVDKFLVFTLCLSGFWPVGIGFSVRWRFSVWVVWLFRGWPGRPGGIILVHCVLCCAGDSGSARWRELMENGISSPYIFLFILLLIPFLVIG